LENRFEVVVASQNDPTVIKNFSSSSSLGRANHSLAAAAWSASSLGPADHDCKLF